MTNYDRQRPTRPEPHVSLRSLRLATGLTLDKVADAVTAALDIPTAVNRGTISAIELGHRGASQEMLDALAVAYGLDPGSITTSYEPRARVGEVPA